MNIKNTGRMAILLAAGTALVASLLNDKKRKEEAMELEKEKIEE